MYAINGDHDLGVVSAIVFVPVPHINFVDDRFIG